MLDTLQAGSDCIIASDEVYADTPSMPPDAVALALPSETPYPQWVSIGRSLAARKRNTDWLIGDWIAFGRTNYPEQIQDALFDLGQDQRAIRRIEKTAKAFPPEIRVNRLSFDHHAHVADLPTQDALPLLKQAHDAKSTARQFRIDAMLYKHENGYIIPREDDAEDDAMMALVRSWNRATSNVREDFAEMVKDSGLGVIEL